MSAIKDGGPAFPVPESLRTFSPQGMSMRDYFAGRALQGICASSPGNEWTDALIARDAYALADAMLAAREAQP